MEARTIYLIKRLESIVQENMINKLATYDISPLQYTVMTFVDTKGERFSSAQLSRKFLMTPQSMNEIVTILTKKNLLIKTKKPENKRILLLSLTDTGKNILKECEALINKLELDLFENIEPNELENLRSLMRKVLKNNM